MSKAIAEQSNALSIFWLKKRGCLPKGGIHSGTLTWSYGISGNKSSIGFTIVTRTPSPRYYPKDFEHYTEEEKREFERKRTLNRELNASEKDEYMKLNYTHTNSWTGEKSEMDFKIPLVTTPCKYGGVRYWFICLLSKNGRYCGRRVGVIYSIGKWFGCRHCGNIAYQTQFENSNFRVGSVTEPVVEKAYDEIKRFYYNRKPTRKHQRYLRLRKKMDNSWMKFITKANGIKL